jgi:hypothetical protein
VSHASEQPRDPIACWPRTQPAERALLCEPQAPRHPSADARGQSAPFVEKQRRGTDRRGARRPRVRPRQPALSAGVVHSRASESQPNRPPRSRLGREPPAAARPDRTRASRPPGSGSTTPCELAGVEARGDLVPADAAARRPDGCHRAPRAAGMTPEIGRFVLGQPLNAEPLTDPVGWPPPCELGRR